MVKRKQKKKVVSKESCNANSCDCRGLMIRIGAMAFIMFIVTVWATLGNWLLGVPWWVYLIIWALFCGAAVGMKDKCWCNKM